MNPILPLEHCIPDGEPRVGPDGRLYLYGSCDTPGDTTYCSRVYRVFSTADLERWKDHGPCFSVEASHFGPDGMLYAPDCIEVAGRHYLAYCGDSGQEGLAVGDAPSGPFREARAVPTADGDSIDPALFRDDDGHVYYLWGQFRLRGARLLDDLSGPDPTTLQTNLLDEDRHGFHEAASLRKRDGWYYLVFADISRGRPTALAYAMGRSPLGPYAKRGVIIDNAACDPESWNNHGGICEFGGQWYVFYHRSSRKSRYSRRACCEPIHFNPDGTIDEVPMTTQGPSGPLDPRRWTEASRFCAGHGNLHVQARGIDPANDRHREWLGGAVRGDWAAFRYFRFTGDLEEFVVEAGSAARGGRIELRLDGPEGPSIGRCDVEASRGWQDWRTFRCPVRNVPNDVRALFLVFSGGPGRLMDVNRFAFRGTH